jgi:hypothetical protein
MQTSARSARTAEEPVASATRPRWLRERRVLLYGAILLAVAIRAAHVLAADFPLNDGGLFYRMTQEVREAGFRLPAFTDYNAAQIPFAYSPAAFYLTAAIHAVTGISLVSLFRFLPLLATSLLVVAFYRLARDLLDDRDAVLASVVAFAVVPRSFSWLLMGGGLTRSFGLLCALVAFHQAYRLYTVRSWRYAATTAAACALTVLTHISTAAFLAFSIAILFAFYGRHWRGVAASAVVVVLTVLLTAPWWAAVIAEHGVAPFVAARASSGTVFSDIDSRYTALVRLAQFNLLTTGEPLFPLVGFLAVLGSFTALRPGRLLLPVWWAAITLLDTRAGPTYAAIPAALLAGYGVVDVLIPALRRIYGGTAIALGAVAREPGGPGILRYAPAAILAFFVFFGTASALSRSPDYGTTGDGPGLTALTAADRSAMRWVVERTPPDARFAVVTGEAWHLDKVAEWFPVLARRKSVSTVQGLEWEPGFEGRVQQNIDLQIGCGTADAACLAGWGERTGQRFSHVYVWKRPYGECCTPLIAALKTDPGYAVLYDGPGALIAQRR